MGRRRAGLTGSRQRLLCLALIPLTAFGCRTPVLPPTPTDPPAEIAVDETSPTSVASGFLRLVAAEMDALKQYDSGAAKRLRARQATLAASDELLALVAREPRYKIAVGDDIVEGFVRVWGAVISYYAEGVAYDQARVRDESSNKIATVLLPARGVADQTLIAVRLTRHPDQSWRILSVTFENERASPSSAPTTQPQ